MIQEFAYPTGIAPSPNLTYGGTRSLSEGDGTGINLAVWGAQVSIAYVVAIVTD